MRVAVEASPSIETARNAVNTHSTLLSQEDSKVAFFTAKNAKSAKEMLTKDIS